MPQSKRHAKRRLALKRREQTARAESMRVHPAGKSLEQRTEAKEGMGARDIFR